ncbi:MAG: YybS family protein [Desulfobacteraceae bacterium]
MKVSEVLGCVATATVLLLASGWIPFAGPFFTLLTPLPFLYYTTKLGLFAGVKVLIITLLVVGVIGNLSGYPQSIFLCLEFGLLGLTISEIYRREFTIGRTILWGTGIMLLLGLIILTLIGLSKNMGPLKLVLSYLQNNLRGTVEVYENMGGDPEKAVQFKEYAKILTDIIMKIYPALVIMGTGFVVWFNVVVSRHLFRLGNLQYPDFGPTDQWWAPERMVWGLIAAGFSLFLPVAVIRWMAINTLIVVLTVYVFHGLSIILFFLNKYRVPSWIRLGVYFLIIFQQIFLIGLAFAGLFDQWIDFRKIRHKKGT